MVADPDRPDAYPDALIIRVLGEAKTIALVGASPNSARPSYGVMAFLLSRGHKVIPINPGQAGKTIHGETVYARLSDVPVPVDLVDVFRESAAVSGLVDETLALPSRPKAIWLQLGVRDDAAAARAEDAGLTVIQNRCPAIEYGRLGL